MTTYAIALFLHLAALLLATVAATRTTSLTLALRAAEDADCALAQMRAIERTVKLFPLATLGLVASGAYMTHAAWSWADPWIAASALALGLIVVLGPGVEGSRNRALRSELEAVGLGPRARRLMRDPIAWSAKMITLTLIPAIVFVMTVKPEELGASATIAGAIALALIAALPFWRPRAEGGGAIVANEL
jgi:hypothetical protein